MSRSASVPRPGDLIIVDCSTGKCRIERDGTVIFDGNGVLPAWTPDHVGPGCWLPRDSITVIDAVLFHLGYAKVHVEPVSALKGDPEHRFRLLSPPSQTCNLMN